MSLIIDEHREYLADTARVEAFRSAIQEVVQPGAVVVDLGSGTGILGLLACEAGAARVYSIEQQGMVEVGRAIARANGFGDRVTFIQEISTLVQLPERADVVIADQIGHFGFEAGLWDYFADAERRWLTPDGAFLPQAVGLVVAAVEVPDLFDRVTFWTRRPAGFDFGAVRGWAAHTGYPAHIPPAALLAPAAMALNVRMKGVSPEPFRAAVSMSIEREGTLHGIGGWFEAELSPSVRLTNAPAAADRINRRNLFLPIDRPTPVRPGDALEVILQVDPAQVMISWIVHVRPAAGPEAIFRHSTLRGMLLTPEDLRRSRPDFQPSLTPRGVARRRVLELCDGHHPLAEIERAIFAQYPDLFDSQTSASVFVAEVVSRYSE